MVLLLLFVCLFVCLFVLFVFTWSRGNSAVPTLLLGISWDSVEQTTSSLCRLSLSHGFRAQLISYSILPLMFWIKTSGQVHSISARMKPSGSTFCVTLMSNSTTLLVSCAATSWSSRIRFARLPLCASGRRRPAVISAQQTTTFQIYLNNHISDVK